MSIPTSTSSEQPSTPPATPANDPASESLENIIKSVHPLMVEAFYIAALPHWYDLDVFTAIRDKDDARNEGLIPRLQRYSFILPRPNTIEPTFRARDIERQILNEHWINENASSYLAAHQRAHTYWQNHTSNEPDETYELSDEITYEQNQLYHHYFVNLPNAANQLEVIFRRYYGERLLTATERLLQVADEARTYLHLLDKQNSSLSSSNHSRSNLSISSLSNSTFLGSNRLISNRSGSKTASTEGAVKPDKKDLIYFDHLVDHLYARQAQLQNQWVESISMFEAQHNKPELPRQLIAYVKRGYAQSLKEIGLYVESINEFKNAIDLFKKQAEEQASRPTDQQDIHLSSHAELKITQALTMIDLGDAYANFALSANVNPDRSSARQNNSWWQWLQQIYGFFTSLPLVLLLNAYIGQRVWHPRFWRVLNNLDGITGRLFGKSAQQYIQADKILDKYGSEAESFIASEKLAFLYLKMGDFSQARKLFTYLLELTPSPLSDYHRALVRRGLAEAELALGAPEVARQNLQQSMPVLQAYADASQSAEAQMLLAEVLLTMDEPTLALAQFEQALTYYQQTQNREQATIIHERLKELVHLEELSANHATTAQALADQVTERRYPLRFRSLTTIFTQRASLALLTLVLMLMPLQTIQLESRIAIAPEINFRVPPLLLQNGGDFKPNLSVGVAALNITEISKAETVLRISLWLLLAYLLFVTLMGVLAILSTPMRQVQRMMQSKTLDIDEDGIRFGSQDAKKSASWQDVRQLVRSDMSLFSSRLRVDDSATLIATSANPAHAQKAEFFTIRGNTTWYTPLVDWITTRLPEGATERTLSFSWLRNWVGLLYGMGLLTFTGLTLYTRFFQQTGGRLTTDLPLLHYSLFDLYPYLYMMLFIPPMVWLIVRPLWIRSYLVPKSRAAWLTGGIGVMLLALRILTDFRPWITVPDIYPEGLILIFVVTSVCTIWQARNPGSGQYIFPFWSKAAATMVALVVVLVAGTYVAREVVAYHYLVNGNYYRDHEQLFMQQQEPPISRETRSESNRLLNLALHNYSVAHNITEYPLPRLQRSKTNGINRFGIPSYDQSTWYASGKNIADIASKLGLRNEHKNIQPEVYYEKLLAYVPQDGKASIHIARALALTERGRQPTAQFGNLETSEELYREAVEQFTLAIDNATPEDAARYRLWRAIAYHALYSPDNVTTRGFHNNMIADYEQVLNDAELGLLDDKSAAKALIGLGWIAYQTEEGKLPHAQDFIRAFEHFQLATLKDPQSVEGLLGMGYIHYNRANRVLNSYAQLSATGQATPRGKKMIQRARRQLNNAELLWLHAQSLNPFEPSIPISLATLYWKSGDSAFGQRLTNRCAAYSRSIDLLTTTLNRNDMRIQQDIDVAFTYRTVAEITWLQQEIACPETDPIAFHQHAIEDYRQAIQLDPENADFLHKRARFVDSLVDLHLEDARRTLQHQLDLQQKIFPLLMDALMDMDQALTINPKDNLTTDYQPNLFLGPIIGRALDNGYSLFEKNDQVNATEIYNAAIKMAVQYGGNREEMQDAADKLAKYLEKNPAARGVLAVSGNPAATGEELQTMLARAAAILALNDPALAFAEGLNELTRGNTQSALNRYRRALRLAVDEGNIQAVAAALGDLYAAENETETALKSVSENEAEERALKEIGTLFHQALPQLTQMQKATSAIDALDLSFIAAAAGKIPTSTYWYAEGVRRSTTQGPTTVMEANRKAVQLAYTWQNNETQLQTMLTNIPNMVSDQRFLEPELDENGSYWRTWAWSIYHLGREAFLQGDQEAARLALEIGQPYADEAAALGHAGGDVINTYYREGAWSWYRFLRAEQKQTKANYQGALEDYSMAVLLSRPKTNSVVFAERSQAAFRAGLMALYLQNESLARTWYANGLELVKGDTDKVAVDKTSMDKEVERAIQELKNAIASKPALKSKGEAILQTLTQAQKIQ